MITFDKLKIITNIEDIAEIDTSAFVTQTKDGEILYYKYSQKSPFSLLIMADKKKGILSIEFTGKILLEDYPQLINRHNIRKCFDAINHLNICHIDSDAIIEHGIVNKCDVTRDVSSEKMREIIQQTKQNIINYDKWNCDKYEGNGVVIYKTVKTARYKERLCIYDKGREMGKARNREFLCSISEGEKVADYFKGKIRFELNIDTSAKVIQLLEIPNNRLVSVLSAKANPILKVYDEAIKERNTTMHFTALKERMMAALIRECNNDLEQVEIEIRNTIPKSTSVRRNMDKFRELYAKMQQGKFNPVDVRSLIA